MVKLLLIRRDINPATKHSDSGSIEICIAASSFFNAWAEAKAGKLDSLKPRQLRPRLPLKITVNRYLFRCHVGPLGLLMKGHLD
jgi:hypothetical protein